MSTARHPQRFLGRSRWIVLLIVCCAVNAQAAAVAYTWTGGSNTLWNNSGNWSPSGIPTTGDSVVFAGGTAINLATSNDIGAISLTSITVGAGLTGNVSIAGSAITLSTATGIDASAADRDLTITAALTLGAGLSFTVASGRLVTVGAITNGANLLTIAGAGNVTISGVLGASTGGLTMNSTGTLTLSGVNTYTGLNTLNAGTVVVTQETNLGAVANDVTFGGGTLRISGSFTSNAGKIFTVPALTSGTLQIDGGVTLTDSTATTLVAGIGGTLIKTGTGGLLVQNQNTTFDGTMRIDAGTVEMRGAFDNGFGDATNRATVALNGGTYTISDTAARAMAHSLSVNGASTLVSERSAVGAPLLHTVYDITLAGGSNLTVQPGTNCAGTAGTAWISGTNSTLILGQSSLAVANGATASTRLTLRALNESGGFRQLTKTGSGDLYLSATATAWTGTVDVQAGTLTVAAANALGTASEVWLSGSTTMRVLNDSSISTGAGIRLFGNATLNVDRLAAGSNQTHTNRFIAAGTSTLTVSNANGYACALSGLCDTGTGAISAGAIPLTVGSLSGAGTVTTTGLVTVGSDNTSTTFAGNRTGA